MNWASISGLDIVFCLFGVLMGGVFVLASWKSSLKGTELKNDPRVKSLGWVIGGFFVTLLGRWETLFDIGKVDRGELLLFYTLPLLLTALLGVVAISLMIFVRYAAVRRHHSKDYLYESLIPVLGYLHYGYQYYKENYEDSLEKAQQVRFRELNAVGSNRLALDILAIEGYRRNPSEALRDTLCREILDHICSVVRTYMDADSEAGLNASVMVAVPREEMNEEEWELVKFAYQPREQYRYILILRHYANPDGQEHFAVPVVDPAVVANWQEWVLLGAPDAFLRKKVLVIQTAKLDFAMHVPHNIRQEIDSYFEGKGFRSFACLPVLGEGRLKGIVNVESRQEHIFQESDEVQSEIARVLQPFCTLLGLIAE